MKLRIYITLLVFLSCVSALAQDEDSLYTPARVPADSLIVETVPTEEIAPAKPPKTFMIGFWGGGSYRTNRPDPQLSEKEKDFYSAMRWGYDYGADAVCFFRDWGLGLRYSCFRSYHNGNVDFKTAGGSMQSGMMDGYSKIWFLGPVVALRDTYGEKGNSLYSIYGIGYMGFRMDEEIPYYVPIASTAGTVGYFMEVGTDFRLTDNAYFSVALSYYQGRVHSYTVENNGVKEKVKVDDEKGEGLDYLALNFGLHWYLEMK